MRKGQGQGQGEARVGQDEGWHLVQLYPLVGRYLLRARQTIDEASARNGGQRVLLVAHSAGISMRMSIEYT